MDRNNVLRKIGLLIGVAACGALVTSCGDDETPAPTPTPSDSSTPTPTPSSGGVDFDLAADFSAQSTNAGGIFAYFTPTGGMETFNGATRVNGSYAISFVAATNTATFDFEDLTTPVTFEGSTLVSSSATELAYTNGDEQLFVQLPFGEVLQVIYEIDAQPFTREMVDGTLRSRRVALFFNPTTATDDITATLTYTGDPLAVGGEPGVTGDDVTSPQATFTITPGAEDRVTGTVNVFEDVNGTSTQIAAISIDAVVEANGSFTGDIADATFDLEGTFAGVLAGENREEMVILFSASNADDGRQFLVSFIGN